MEPDAGTKDRSDTPKTKTSATTTWPGIITRAFAVWCILICAEILHGIVRGIFLVPHVGEFRSNQIGVFAGSIIILVVAMAFVKWVGTTSSAQLLTVGFLWLGPTLTFEVLFGRFVMGASWERLTADYNVMEGGLLPFGMLILLLSPVIAAKVRGLKK
jgi:hypothetical protein